MAVLTIDYAGSPMAHKPIERHIFEGSDYLCDKCQRPRALHQQDGFKPRPGFGVETLTTDPKANYHKHPYWWRHRIRLSKEEQSSLDRVRTAKGSTTRRA